YEDMSPGELLNSLRHWAQTQSSGAPCKIVKCRVEEAPIAHTSMIEEALRDASAWVGETGLLVLLSDIQPAAVERFVNINNFLAEMGVIERDEQSGQINWSNSLAY